MDSIIHISQKIAHATCLAAINASISKTAGAPQHLLSEQDYEYIFRLRNTNAQGKQRVVRMIAAQLRSWRTARTTTLYSAQPLRIE
jgi:hypothetical protein